MSGKVNSQNEKINKQWERLDSIISREYSASYMSNSKWVKLLKAVCVHHADIPALNYKLVYSDEIKTTYIEEYEEHIDNNWFREPLIYKEIEWLEFPVIGNQNLELALNKLGQFQLVKTDTSIRVLGYAKA